MFASLLSGLLAVAIAALIVSPALAVNSTSPQADVAGFCPIYVSYVAPVDTTGTMQAVALRAKIAGSATLDGTIALFTVDDRRYDVPFHNIFVSNTARSHELRYHFSHPVKITGAYVASLDEPTPGPCEPAYPWLPPVSFRADPPSPPPTDPIEIAGDGAPAPRSCTQERKAETLTAAEPRTIGGMQDIRFIGNVWVQVTLDTNSQIIDTRIHHVTTATDDRQLIERAEREAIVTTDASTFEIGTFRCEPVITDYLFVVMYQ